MSAGLSAEAEDFHAQHGDPCGLVGTSNGFIWALVIPQCGVKIVRRGLVGPNSQYDLSDAETFDASSTRRLIDPASEIDNLDVCALLTSFGSSEQSSNAFSG